MQLRSGDIILLKRPKRTWAGYLFTLIKEIYHFFFKKEGLVEMVDKFYHIEMAYDETRSVTMQPPKCHIHPIPNGIRVYRLRTIKPYEMSVTLRAYAATRLGYKFDFVGFWMRMLDGILGTHRFSNQHYSHSRDICAEFVARFYQDWIQVPCISSEHTADNIIPADVNRYCADHPTLWEMVRDDT